MWKIFFFKNDAENEVGKLVPDTFFFLKEALYKTSGQHLSFNIFC